ncbi:phage tail assembly chaperone (plasmid) [Roseomonas marmotae]|uniref:tail fiber assembly protein n=1 Tax=Roseomonas marmotae TaxID=2768161 RepID=UPI001AD723A2|nr:tail fiber assembly protein [Roseomonas marmotae]QTI81500.1 phage tail assembly chaperone [Roseomonas marmotae]
MEVMKYAASTGGFYDPAIHKKIPAGAVEITDKKYRELLAGQSAGKLIQSDAQGRPVLVDPPDPAPTPEQLAELVRTKRNALLTACDWTSLPDAPLTEEQRAAWRAYRQALRDVTDQPGFPADVVWPTPPA